jgi:hypothetical protein
MFTLSQKQSEILESLSFNTDSSASVGLCSSLTDRSSWDSLFSLQSMVFDVRKDTLTGLLREGHVSLLYEIYSDDGMTLKNTTTKHELWIHTQNKGNQ